jgi:uncharacterized membrane protein YbhN (UPF0104 family)
MVLDVRPWRSSVLGFAVLAAGLFVLGSTQFGRGSVDQAMASLEGAHAGWLLVAGAGFAGGLLCSAAAWRAGLRACGGEAGFTDVAARYAIGSLVNSAAPAHIGGAVRIGLLSRTLCGSDPVWRACGVATTITVARAFGLAALVFAAAAVGRLPLWPAPLLLLVVAVALAVCMRLSTRVAGKIGAVLQAFRSPRAALDVFSWVTCAWAVRVAATVAVVAALEIPRALPVAIVLVAAVALAGVLPLTPGNIGAGAGAATLALHGTGVSVGTALALGIALQAVETCTAIALGVSGAAFISAPGTRIRRWSLVMVSVMAVGLAATVGVATVDLV